MLRGRGPNTTPTYVQHYSFHKGLTTKYTITCILYYMYRYMCVLPAFPSQQRVSLISISKQSGMDWSLYVEGRKHTHACTYACMHTHTHTHTHQKNNNDNTYLRRLMPGVCVRALGASSPYAKHNQKSTCTIIIVHYIALKSKTYTTVLTAWVWAVILYMYMHCSYTHNHAGSRWEWLIRVSES